MVRSTKWSYAVENARPVTPDGARPFDTPHPRCGTGFALLTVWSACSASRFARRGIELCAGGDALRADARRGGHSYEIIKMTTHPRWGAFFMKLMAPGMWLQRLTTHQPDDAAAEVSCAAMRVVLRAEEEFAASTQTN
jgi:uncharacterized protein YqhQ